VSDLTALALRTFGAALLVRTDFSDERSWESLHLNQPPRAEFRVVVSLLWSVENNLSLSNLDWADFAGNVGDDEVFRGF
jgi:hypothetical protein